jgi:hypothetical protein
MGSSFSWIANLTAGTSVTFSMINSQGRKGGTLPIKVVGLTNNNSCLAPTVVTSSGSGVTSSRTTSTSGSSQTSKSNSGQGRSKIRTIIGAAAGGFALVGITAFLFFCFSRNGCAKSGYRPNQKVDFIYNLVSPHDVFILPAGYTPALAPQESSHNSALASTPFLSATPAQHASTAIPLASRFGKANSVPQFDNSNAPLQFHDPNAPHRLGTPDASQQQFSPNAPQRFGAPNVPRLILHTDIEETMELQVELPPQYSESRAPIPGLLASNDVGLSAATSRIWSLKRAGGFDSSFVLT